MPEGAARCRGGGSILIATRPQGRNRRGSQGAAVAPRPMAWRVAGTYEISLRTAQGRPGPKAGGQGLPRPLGSGLIGRRVHPFLVTRPHSLPGLRRGLGLQMAAGTPTGAACSSHRARMHLRTTAAMVPCADARIVPSGVYDDRREVALAVRLRRRRAASSRSPRHQAGLDFHCKRQHVLGATRHTDQESGAMLPVDAVTAPEATGGQGSPDGVRTMRSIGSRRWAFGSISTIPGRDALAPFRMARP
jgi:hypothetical protein